jgi:hypothetical protein
MQPEDRLSPEEMQRMVNEIMMSPTMSKLLRLAQSMPLDMHSQDDIKVGLTTASLDIIRSLDAGEIKAPDETMAMLHALLIVAMEIIFDGKFASGARSQTLQ